MSVMLHDFILSNSGQIQYATPSAEHRSSKVRIDEPTHDDHSREPETPRSGQLSPRGSSLGSSLPACDWPSKSVEIAS
jgi:hypothetical protein